MAQRIALVTVTVRDYDEAIAFYVDRLGFALLEDTDLGDGKRWVRVRPPGQSGAAILLARAASDAQKQSIGNQTGGRVFMFVETDDFWDDYNALVARGVRFVRPPCEAPYGTVAVFEDLYGNQFDLVQRSADASGAPRVQRHEAAGELLARAGAWLSSAEAENHLILGILGNLQKDPARQRAAPYLASIEAGGAVVGVAVMTPPYHVVVTRSATEVLAAVVDDLTGSSWKVTGVHAVEQTAREFSERWCARNGGSFVRKMAMRAHVLERVNAVPRVQGMLRAGRPEDLELAARWFRSFEDDAHVMQRAGDYETLARRHFDGGGLFFWDHEGPVSMAIATGPTPRGIRVGGVYTPAALRGKGYATACVAALSQHLLDSGRTFCFLYTDIDNSTSNAIYRRIGYASVADFGEYEFVS